MSFESLLRERFVRKKASLALAESCTGGALAARITRLPGASDFFLGSVVAYALDAKRNLLGVDEQTLSVCGAVSEETAVEMAQGALKVLQADIVAAVTGIAGPSGAQPLKPVGTVCWSVATRLGSIRRGTVHYKGDRAEVIAQACDDLLKALVDAIDGWPS